MRELSDEAFGRAWAAQQKVEPLRYSWKGRPRWEWVWAAMVDGRLPIVRDHMARLDFASEKAAYAELGRAVRRVHAAVPPLKGRKK